MIGKNWRKVLHVWKGLAAMQTVPNSSTNCYLKGGRAQLWLEPCDIDNKGLGIAD